MKDMIMRHWTMFLSDVSDMINTYLADDASILNIRGIPTRECICGSTLFTIQAEFDEEYELSGYLLDAHCAYCGCKLTAPTPLDLVEA